MGKYASKVVEQAKAWIGCNEADGSHKQIIDIYNNHKPLARGYKVKYTDEWCATFVSAVAIKLGYTDIIPTECSCTKMIELLKKIGSFVENDAHVPAPGSIIFYDWQDSQTDADHVGIVERVVGDTIHVIEGNYKNGVNIRTIRIDGKYIRGFGVPKYDAEPAKTKTVDQLAKEVLNGKWGNGDARKAKLTAAGYDYEAVQKRVNELIKNPASKTIDQIAKEVINGKWGNGATRKDKLIAAGYDYEAVQKRVNELLK